MNEGRRQRAEDFYVGFAEKLHKTNLDALAVQKMVVSEVDLQIQP